MNSGHGHVYPREDGIRIRCGGVGICTQCSQDFVAEQISKKRLADKIARFNAHIDACQECLTLPFVLCPIGNRIILTE